MGLLRDILSLGQHHSLPSVNLNFPGHGQVYHAPVPQATQQGLNAQIEADGAKMYNQAHPGQVYKTNQNNEFAAGQLPSYMVPGAPNYVGAPTPGMQAFRPLTHGNPIVRGQMPSAMAMPQNQNYMMQQASPDIQGTQNPGFIPLQSSRGVRDIQAFPQTSNIRFGKG